MHCVCLYEFTELYEFIGLDLSLTTGGTRNIEFVCYNVLLWTTGQMVMIGPTT